MKKLKKDEIYDNLGKFLRGKGIELTDGSFSSRLRQGCSILTNSINFAQDNLGKAKAQIDGKLDRMRQIIHDKTAPKLAPKPASPPPKAAAKPKRPAKKAAPKKTAPARKSKASSAK